MIISLAIFFFFSQIASYTLTAQAVDVTSSDSQFFDSVTVKDAKGQIVDGSKGNEPALTPGDEVILTYEWSLKKIKKHIANRKSMWRYLKALHLIKVQKVRSNLLIRSSAAIKCRRAAAS